MLIVFDDVRSPIDVLDVTVALHAYPRSINAISIFVKTAAVACAYDGSMMSQWRHGIKRRSGASTAAAGHPARSVALNMPRSAASVNAHLARDR